MSVCAGVSESGSGTAEACKSAGYVETVSDVAFKCTRGDTASCTCTTLPTGGASTGILFMLLCACTQKWHNEVDIRKPDSIINSSGGSLKYPIR